MIWVNISIQKIFKVYIESPWGEHVHDILVNGQKQFTLHLMMTIIDNNSGLLKSAENHRTNVKTVKVKCFHSNSHQKLAIVMSVVYYKTNITILNLLLLSFISYLELTAILRLWCQKRSWVAICF